MSEYRIKIEERYNGVRVYTPQYCKLEITRGWIQRQRLVWYNIIPRESGFTLSNNMSAGYATEEAAMKIIEDYKNKDFIEHGGKVKSTTYMYPDSSN